MQLIPSQLRHGYIGKQASQVAVPKILRQCQSKNYYFGRTSEPYFAAIDFSGFFRIDPSGLTATSSIQIFALTMPLLPYNLLFCGSD